MSTACKKWITSSRKLEIQAVIAHQMFPRSHCFSEFSCLLPQRNGIRCHGSQQNANQSNGNRSNESRVIRWNANHQNVKHQNAIRQNAIRPNALHRAAHHWHQHQPSGYRPLCSLSSKKNTHKHCLLPLESKICNIYDMFRNWGRSHQRSAHLPHTLPWWRTPDDSCLWQQTETFPSLSHHRAQRFILKNQLTTYHLPLTLLHWWPSDLVVADCSSAMHSASTHWPSW